MEDNKSSDMRQPWRDLEYLCSCCVRGEKPDSDRLHSMNTERVFACAGKQKLEPIAAMALEKGGMRTPRTSRMLAEAMVRADRFENAWQNIRKALDEAGIWYAPMKGMVLQYDYPVLGLRWMGDYDVLFDPKRSEDVKNIFLDRGYQCKLYRVSHHDIYSKAPGLCFEMHRELFRRDLFPEFEPYYRDLKKRLVSDGDNTSALHFSLEDHYIFILVHQYMHFMKAGTGLRSLLDIYLFLKAHGAELDRRYVKRELEKLGISGYSELIQGCALHLFSGERLSSDEEELLLYMENSGVHGNRENRIQRLMETYGDDRRGRLRYYLRSCFPPVSTIRYEYPRASRFIVLIPFLYPVRLIAVLIFKSDVVKNDNKLFRKSIKK